MSFVKRPLNVLLCSTSTSTTTTTTTTTQFFRVILMLSGFIALTTSTENYFTTNSEQFSSVPTTVKTYENDTVLLPCYTVGPHRFVRWLREDVLIADSNHPEMIPPSRITLYSNGSLEVRNVRRNDTAEYLCEVMTEETGLESQLHAIEVQFSPQVISQPSGRIEVKLGTVFEIVCEAIGTPQPIISWRLNGRGDRMEPSSRRRLIEVRSRDMSGPIECIANNGVGQPATAGIELIVQFPPEVHAPIAIVHTKLAINAQIECQVTSLPQANVHWFHHGIPVITDYRITRQDHAIALNETVSGYHTHTKHLLIIRNVKENDFGMYDCRAENPLGINSATVELTGRPMPPIFKKSPLMSAFMTHNLIWQTESQSPIFEYKLKFRQVPSGNITPLNRNHPVDWNELIIPADVSEGPIHTIGYTLRGLMPASVYEVNVISRNRFGWSDNSRTIRFATSGEIEMPSYSTESTEEDVNDGKRNGNGNEDEGSEDDEEDEDSQNYINDLNSPTNYEDIYNSLNAMPSDSTMRMHFNAYTLLFSCLLIVRYCCCSRRLM